MPPSEASLAVGGRHKQASVTHTSSRPRRDTERVRRFDTRLHTARSAVWPVSCLSADNNLWRQLVLTGASTEIRKSGEGCEIDAA